MAKVPESIKNHSGDYKNQAWTQYTLYELGNWVHLFAKRALHRGNNQKASKDLYDAQNYLNMMQSLLDEVKDNVETDNQS
jgi:hypothetical protein